MSPSRWNPNKTADEVINEWVQTSINGLFENYTTTALKYNGLPYLRILFWFCFLAFILLTGLTAGKK